MGKKGKSKHEKYAQLMPQDRVKKLMKAGKLKKKCCRSQPRCKKCPVLALRTFKAEAA